MISHAQKRWQMAGWRASVLAVLATIGTFSFGLGSAQAATLQVPEDHTTIQAAINASSNGDTIQVGSGTYMEQVTVNKSVTLSGSGDAMVKAPALAADASVFTVTVADVTIQGLHIELNRPHARYAINSTGNNLTVRDNTISMTGTGATWPRIGIFVQGSDNNYTIEGNAIHGADASLPFEGRGISTHSVHGIIGGTDAAEGNTIHAWFDVLSQFSQAGTTTIQNNTFKGGGVDITEPNPGLTRVLSNTFSPGTTEGAQSLLVKNADQEVLVQNNTFSGHKVGVRLANSTQVTVDNNSFTAGAGLTDFAHIIVNNKVVTSGTIAPKTIAATMTKNTFHAGASAGGTAILMQNHNSTGATFGTFTVGGSIANANTFANNLADFIRLSEESFADSRTQTQYPDYAAPTSATTGAPFSGDVNALYNNFGGLQEDAAIEAKIYHQPDNAALGLVTFSTLSDDTYLSDLTVSTGTLMPTFSSGTTMYTVELPAGTTEVPTVTATPQQEDATVTITDAPSVPGTTKVKVTAANGGERTYNVYFYRADEQLPSNSYLSNMTVSTGTLVPQFTPAVELYTVELPAGTTEVPTVTATQEDPNATVTITNATSLPGTTVVTVRAVNGETRDYQIGFYRTGETPPTNGNTNTNGNGNTNTNPPIYTGGGGGGSPTPGNTSGNNNANTNGNANSNGVTPAGTNNNVNAGSNGNVNLNSNGSGGTVTIGSTVFTDIHGHWGSEYMIKLISHCTLTGYMSSDGSALGLFGPDNSITRAELAQMLARCEGIQLSSATVNPFTDVPMDEWFAAAVTAIKGRGWIQGYEDGTFRPHLAVNRAEALKLVLTSEFADATITGTFSTMTDVDMSSWYGRFVAFAEARGFISGYKDANGTPLNLFNPSGQLTRAEAAKLIVLIKGY